MTAQTTRLSAWLDATSEELTRRTDEYQNELIEAHRHIGKNVTVTVRERTRNQARDRAQAELAKLDEFDGVPNPYRVLNPVDQAIARYVATVGHALRPERAKALWPLVTHRFDGRFNLLAAVATGQGIDDGQPVTDEEHEVIVLKGGGRGVGRRTSPSQSLATERQVSFIKSLVRDRAPTPELLAQVGTLVANEPGELDEWGDPTYTGYRYTDGDTDVDLDKATASLWIDTLKSCPFKATIHKDVPGLDIRSIPSGRYAVPGGETRLKVKVEHGKPGTRWEGWVFVKDAAVYGEGRRYGMQRPGQEYQGDIADVLSAIKADPIEASRAYGRLTSTCGVCGRALEDEDSVRAGIGPICAGKLSGGDWF